MGRWMEQESVDTGRHEGLTSAECNQWVELRRRHPVPEMEVEAPWRANLHFADDKIPSRR